MHNDQFICPNTARQDRNAKTSEGKRPIRYSTLLPVSEQSKQLGGQAGGTITRTQRRRVRVRQRCRCLACRTNERSDPRRTESGHPPPPRRGRRTCALKMSRLNATDRGARARPRTPPLSKDTFKENVGGGIGRPARHVSEEPELGGGRRRVAANFDS